MAVKIDAAALETRRTVISPLTSGNQIKSYRAPRLTSSFRIPHAAMAAQMRASSCCCSRRLWADPEAKAEAAEAEEAAAPAPFPPLPVAPPPPPPRVRSCFVFTRLDKYCFERCQRVRTV
jgi:hypothetical protein